MRTYSRIVSAMGIMLATTVFLAAQAGVRYVPEELPDTTWLEQLRDAQVKAAAGLAVFHDFRFTDRLSESGISFRHRIVDDAGKTYKAVHYDHGNGLAIADVDGDGLSDIYFTNQVGGNQLWKNAGGGKFQNITASAGVAVAGRSASRHRLPTSTTTGTRTCTSRRFAPATGSSRTTAGPLP